MPGFEPDVRLIASPAELLALGPAWNALAARAPGYHVSQTHAWSTVAWETVAAPRGDRLACLTAWSEGRLVGTWAFAVHARPFLTLASPLGSGSAEEYSAPLIEDAPHAEATALRLWQAARRLADVVRLSFVREGSLIHGVLLRSAEWATTVSSPAPFVSFARSDGWAEFERTLSSSLRYELRRDRRRLAERGHLAFERVEDPERCTVLIDWIIDQKTRWMRARRLTHVGIGTRPYRAFLVGMAHARDPAGALGVFALTVDGAPIAAALNLVDPVRVEGFVVAFDPAWSSCSPGKVLAEGCLRWACDRGRDFDFRITEQAYKKRWANRDCQATSYDVAMGLKGLAFLGATEVARRLRRAKERLNQRMAERGRRRASPEPKAAD